MADITTPKPFGRPSTYTREVQEACEYYLYNWEEFDAIPSRAGLCVFIGIARPTSFDWQKKHKKFAKIIEAIQVRQEQVLLSKGLHRTFSSTITKLILTNHGYSDKQNIDHTSGGAPLQPNQVNITAVDPIEAARQYKEIMEQGE